jgi:hypothetical protein
MMILAGVWASSCTESPLGQTPTDSVPPPPLTNVVVEEFPGGAKITYDLPADVPDMSYVKCEYLFQGLRKTVRASAYDNQMTIEGLGSTDPVEITLYLVDRSENASAPVSKTFNPLKPPIESIFESLTMDADWGGLLVQWDNPLGIEIGVTFLTTDTLGEFSEVETRFFLSKEGSYAFRGFDSLERRFGIRIMDRWNNVSPVKETTVAPIYEKQLDRSLHKQFVLPWDNTSTNGGGQTFDKIFDGQKINTGNNSWHTKESEPATTPGFTHPVLFTVDLGVDAILNRLIWWQGRWAEYFLFGHHNPKTFEVWGTTEIPVGKPNDYWLEEWKNDWTKLADYELVKPSGLPIGTISDEDRNLANSGHECYMLSTVRVKYLRFVIKSTWVGDRDNTITLHEIEFYGNDK